MTMNWTPEQMCQLMYQMVPFVARAGVRVDEVRKGFVKMSLPLEGNGNHIGGVYAGALFTLGELPGGGLFMSTFDVEKFFPIVKEMNIRFLKLAETDVSIEVTLTDEEIRRIERDAAEKGKAEYILDSDIRDTHGEVVASCKGVYQLRAIKPPG